MANCCICGGKIGGWGADRLTLEPGKECCHLCAPIVRSLDEAENGDTFFFQYEKLSREMDKHATPYDIRKLLEDKRDKIVLSKGFIDTKNKIRCFICGQFVEPNADTCTNCGFTFKNPLEKNRSELINIYNSRFEQYLKNPLYEYKVETVKDSFVLGKFEQEEIQRMIDRYAMRGWRLHSAFTNEIGKNAALGVNATINQTILIFERCIKAEEK